MNDAMVNEAKEKAVKALSELCIGKLLGFEKQGEQKHNKNIIETWKDMRLEVYQQASGNRHEPNYSDDTTKMFSLNDIDEIIEKISEQKPADKIEPKFKVGDWVVWDNKISCHIDNIYQGKESLMYTITDVHNMTRSYSVKGFDNNARLWSIKDAKDGDVLASKNAVFIFKHKDKTGLSLCRSYCEVIGNSKLGFGFDFSINDVYPATKEQRDHLFTKMKEAGYKWDAEKKELQKNEQISTWSEEDDAKMKSILFHIEDVENKDVIDWVKSLKDRVQPHPKQEWSEEDEKTLNEMFSVAGRASLRKNTLFGKSYDYIKWQKWLKSIKDRYAWKPSYEQLEALWCAAENYLESDDTNVVELRGKST